MDRTIAVIHQLPAAEVDDPEIVRKLRRVFFKAQAKTKYIVEALLKAPVGSKRFLIFSNDGIVTFEAGTDQVFLYQGVNIACPVFRDILQNGIQWCSTQGDLFQAPPKRGAIRECIQCFFWNEQSPTPPPNAFDLSVKCIIPFFSAVFKKKRRQIRLGEFRRSEKYFSDTWQASILWRINHPGSLRRSNPG